MIYPYLLSLSSSFVFRLVLLSVPVTTIIGPTFQGGYGDPHPLHSLVKGNAKVRSYAPDEEREANLVILSILKERERVLNHLIANNKKVAS